MLAPREYYDSQDAKLQMGNSLLVSPRMVAYPCIEMCLCGHQRRYPLRELPALSVRPSRIPSGQARWRRAASHSQIGKQHATFPESTRQFLGEPENIRIIFSWFFQVLGILLTLKMISTIEK